MKVFHKAFVVMKGEKIAANLYMLKGETLQEVEAYVASCSSDSAMLWHQKLGHMSEQGMKVLVEQKLLLCLTKLDPKSRKCKFLGYADRVKGCRLWDHTTCKVIISRDVIFVEDKLQRKEDNDGIVKENSEATQIQVEKEFEQSDSFEVEPEHEEPELKKKSKAPTTRQSDRVKRSPN
ncbi:hypothetical protein V6N11_036697 [Hibiscus sabdariffa]|uniref:Retroviral polymerase SH3-like domain-containing protein n=1 Tax=Hibiscus sabdariffa TaxID=183260 RepID=A0ABR2RB46_9ROSI